MIAITRAINPSIGNIILSVPMKILKPTQKTNTIIRKTIILISIIFISRCVVRGLVQKVSRRWTHIFSNRSFYENIRIFVHASPLEQFMIIPSYIDSVKTGTIKTPNGEERATFISDISPCIRMKFLKLLRVRMLWFSASVAGVFDINLSFWVNTHVFNIKRLLSIGALFRDQAS